MTPEQIEEKAWRIVADLMSSDSIIYHNGDIYHRCVVMQEAERSPKFTAAINAMLQGDSDPIADLIMSTAFNIALKMV